MVVVVARLRVCGWIVVSLGMLLGACGGEEGGETAAAATGANGAPTISGTTAPSSTSTSEPPRSEPPRSGPLTIEPPPTELANRTPTITGGPATAVMHGTQYTFTPTGYDPEGTALTYSIANAPAWASFDTATGRLSGTPEAAHVGTTHGIVISVSDGERDASLAAFTLTVQAVATGSATLSWVPPTTNSDGTPLTNLVAYKIYWGSSADGYPNSVTLDNPGLTRYVVTNLVAGTWYFAATALNDAGAESAFSPPAVGTIQ